MNVYFNEVKADSLDSGQVKEFMVDHPINVRVNIENYQKSGTMLVPSTGKTALYVKVEPANGWRCFLRTENTEAEADVVTDPEPKSEGLKNYHIGIIITVLFLVCALVGYISMKEKPDYSITLPFGSAPKACYNYFGHTLHTIGIFGTPISALITYILKVNS